MVSEKLWKLLIFIFILFLLSACGTGFQEKGGSYVYVVWNESDGKVEHPVQSTDPGTFQVLDSGGYAKDSQNVFYHWQIIEGADPASFEAISGLYGKDVHRVYYRGREIPGADPEQFELLNIQWGRDGKDVYRQDIPIRACDPASFKFLKDSWQRDDQCVYREGRKVEGADTRSFKVLNFWYAKDKNNVYDSFPRVIPGADPASFKLRDGKCQVCAQDKNHCYRYEEVVDCN
jgi:hypothetical protein